MTQPVDIRILLGKNIRRLRKEKKLTQDSLAELLGISVITLSKIENSKTWPRRALIQNLAAVLDVHPFELFVENITNVDRYKELVISAFVNEIDTKFPSAKKTDDPSYVITHKDS